VFADNSIITADNVGLAYSNVELTQKSTSGSGAGFTLTPIRPADTPDINDEFLKFPRTDVFQ